MMSRKVINLIIALTVRERSAKSDVLSIVSPEGADLAASLMQQRRLLQKAAKVIILGEQLMFQAQRW